MLLAFFQIFLFPNNNLRALHLLSLPKDTSFKAPSSIPLTARYILAIIMASRKETAVPTHVALIAKIYLAELVADVLFIPFHTIAEPFFRNNYESRFTFLFEQDLKHLC